MNEPLRVVLDTCAVRNYIEERNPIPDVTALSHPTADIRVSIADGAMAELANQLLEGRIPFNTWSQRVHMLDAAMDSEWPILPGGQELAQMAGLQAQATLNLGDARAYYQASWDLMKDATSVQDLTSGATYTDSQGAKQIRFDEERIAEVMAQERLGWVSHIRQMQNLLGGQTLGTEEIISLALLGLSPQDDEPSDLDSKLDALGRLLGHFISMSLQQGAPYNPASQRRRGDVFDLWLLLALPLPAVICTADGPFLRRLRQTGSPQALAVISVLELNDHLNNGTLNNLVVGS